MSEQNKKENKNGLMKPKSATKGILGGFFAESKKQIFDKTKLKNKKDDISTKNETKKTVIKKGVFTEKFKKSKQKKSFWLNFLNFKERKPTKQTEKTKVENKKTPLLQNNAKNKVEKPIIKKEISAEKLKKFQQKKSFFGNFFKQKNKKIKKSKISEAKKLPEIFVTKTEKIKENSKKAKIENKKIFFSQNETKDKFVQKEEKKENLTNKEKKNSAKKLENKKKTIFASIFGFANKKTTKQQNQKIENKPETTNTAKILQNQIIKNTEQNLEKKQSVKKEILFEKEDTKPKEQSSKGLLSKLFQKSVLEDKKDNVKKIEKEKKNLFVDLFPQEAKQKDDDSLIETIVEQSDQKQSILGQKLQDKRQTLEKISKNVGEEAPANELLFWSKVTLGICVFIPFLIYIYFYYQITPQSKILDLLAIKNIGMQYKETYNELSALNTGIDKINTSIKKLEENSSQKLLEETILQIKANSINCLDVLEYINEVTNRGVKYNDLLKRVTYLSYSLDGKNNKIILNASIFDPNKQTFNLATSLIDAINDSEYFESLEIRNFAKSFTEEGATMPLAMSFDYIPENQRKSLSTVLDEIKETENVLKKNENLAEKEETNT